MCRSAFFAQIIGCYLVLISLAMLIHHARFKKVVTECLESPALMSLGGSWSLIIGLLILVPHNVWVWQWPILVTLVGWFCIFQAIMRLFFPRRAIHWMKHLLSNKGFLFYNWIWLIIGIYLTWMGFTSC